MHIYLWFLIITGCFLQLQAASEIQKVIEEKCKSKSNITNKDLIGKCGDWRPIKEISLSQDTLHIVSCDLYFTIVTNACTKQQESKPLSKESGIDIKEVCKSLSTHLKMYKADEDDERKCYDICNDFGKINPFCKESYILLKNVKETVENKTVDKKSNSTHNETSNVSKQPKSTDKMPVAKYILNNAEYKSSTALTSPLVKKGQDNKASTSTLKAPVHQEIDNKKETVENLVKSDVSQGKKVPPPSLPNTEEVPALSEVDGKFEDPDQISENTADNQPGQNYNQGEKDLTDEDEGAGMGNPVEEKKESESAIQAKPNTLIDDPISSTSEIDGDSQLFTYFMVFCIIGTVGYVGYHNRQKILALMLEGKRGRRPSRTRRPNSASYHKLDSNLEEAISSSCSKNTNNVIY